MKTNPTKSNELVHEPLHVHYAEGAVNVLWRAALGLNWIALYKWQKKEMAEEFLIWAGSLEIRFKIRIRKSNCTHRVQGCDCGFTKPENKSPEWLDYNPLKW